MGEKQELGKSKLGGYLAYVAKTVTADSEEDLTFLYDLLAPSDDREEMGKIYNDTLGYNPIEYFDERFLIKTFDEIIEDAPAEKKTELTNAKESIIKEVMYNKVLQTDEYLLGMLLKAIQEETGWVDPKYGDLEDLEDGDWDVSSMNSDDEDEDDEDEYDPYEDDEDDDLELYVDDDEDEDDED